MTALTRHFHPLANLVRTVRVAGFSVEITNDLIETLCVSSESTSFDENYHVVAPSTAWHRLPGQTSLVDGICGHVVVDDHSGDDPAGVDAIRGPVFVKNLQVVRVMEEVSPTSSFMSNRYTDSDKLADSYSIPTLVIPKTRAIHPPLAPPLARPIHRTLRAVNEAQVRPVSFHQVIPTLTPVSRRTSLFSFLRDMSATRHLFTPWRTADKRDGPTIPINDMQSLGGFEMKKEDEPSGSLTVVGKQQLPRLSGLGLEVEPTGPYDSIAGLIHGRSATTEHQPFTPRSNSAECTTKPPTPTTEPPPRTRMKTAESSSLMQALRRRISTSTDTRHGPRDSAQIQQPRNKHTLAPSGLVREDDVLFGRRYGSELEVEVAKMQTDKRVPSWQMLGRKMSTMGGRRK